MAPLEDGPAFVLNLEVDFEILNRTIAEVF
jgi:hypothetical protein